VAESAKKRTNTVLALTSRGLGRGDDELGQTLAINFLRTLAFRDDVPGTIVCYNEGVRLAEVGSPAVPLLEALVQAARARGDQRIVLSAQVHALRFYRAHGFEAEGPIYQEAGIPHQAMSRAL
jgi:predicted GNAT family N-acyltransferase